MKSLVASRPSVKIGDQFGRLTVIGQPFLLPYSNGMRRQVAVCECKCGLTVVASAVHLKRGNTTSCGCWRSEYLTNHQGTHGLASRKETGHVHPLYSVWRDMRSRCNSPTHRAYVNYGGRGITICDEWNTSEGFQLFYEWATTHGYERGLCLDRRDNESGYSPKNCRFVTMAVNNANKRTTKRN